ncbi:dynactin subunit 1-like isoform X4 [Homarus americanus]|uniref:dynactin subunit 1-like isoform X4 n=1 Tax=Homarus americanus TaxID=6706 RepID=UPI001C46F55C|nr:dynactin subunit 1-like isoform X4 [Homarus americanus]
MSEKPLRNGQRVEVIGKDTLGTIAYVGGTHFSQGKWIGVVLDEKKGKNNGSVQGKSYFQCEDGYGIFVRQSQLLVLDDENGEDGSSATTASNSSTATTPASDKPKTSVQRLERRPSRFGGHQSMKRRVEPTRLPMLGKLQQPRVYGSATPTTPASSNLPRTPSLSSVSSSPCFSPLFKTPSQTSLKSSKTDISKLGSSKSDLTKSESLSNVLRASPKLDLSRVLSKIDCGDKSLLKRPPSVNSIDSMDGGTLSPRSSSSRTTPFRKPIAPTPLKANNSRKNELQAKLPIGSAGKGGGRDDRTPSKESSPRADMKKPSAFVETGFVETLTPQYTPGAPSSAMQTLEDRVVALQNQQEMENLRGEIHDLNEKLETLRVKRAQDKEKLKEAEKMKLQYEQLVEFKSRIMESQAQLQREIQKAKAEAREALETRDRHMEDTEELSENVEMLTLDKEMAEEKAETLQLELDQAGERIEELTLDLEILRAEMSGTAPIGESGVSSLQVKQLEQQNSRLRETLVKMRDLSAHDKHELQKIQKDMETKKTEITDLSRAKEKLASQTAQLEQTISDLQEQVDAALGAEEMVEMLTDRNLNLEEKVAELLETVLDLEAINDMNDQLQENARELELELREELDMANSKIREVLREREAANEVIVDQDTTIKKFRELVQKQQEQNIDLRHSLEKETNKPIGTPSEIIDFKKMFTETKAHSKAIDMELRRLEVAQANQHVSYLTQYMPDNFMTRGGDHDAVLVLLLVARMIWKAEIVVGGVRDKYSSPEVIDRKSVLKTHSVEQYAFSSRLLQLLYTLQTLLHQYQHVLGTCNVDIFLKLGTLYPDMASHERNVDFYVDLLRKDQLDENIPTEALEKTVSYFSSVYPAHLSSEKMDQTLYLSDTARVLSSATDATSTYSATITTMLHPQHETCEVALLCKDVNGASKEIQGAVRRIRRRMPQDGSVGPLSYPQEVQDALTTAITHMNNSARALNHVTKACLQQASLLSDSENGITGDKLKELTHQATDLIYGGEDLGPESIRLSLQRTQNEICRIANVLEKGEYDFDGTMEERSVPPVTLRAQARKNEMKDTEHIKYKLENKEQDIKDLKLTLKQKNEEFSEMTVRRDLAEKKLSTATRDADITIEKLQRKLDDTLMMLRRKEKEYDETMDHLQSDIESLESEKGELREKLKALNKKTLYEALSKSSPLTGGVSPSSPTTPSGGVAPAVGGGMVRDSPMLLQQISDLRTALNHATAASHYVTAHHMQHQLASLRPIKVQKLGLVGEEKRDVSKDDSDGKGTINHINHLKRRASHLQKEVNAMMTGVKVVDLSKRQPATQPATDSASPAYHLINHNNKLNRLRSEFATLQDEITRTLAISKPGGSITTAFSSFPSPQLTKVLAEQDLVQIGCVKVPGSVSNSVSSESIQVVLQPDNLRTLHLRLLK